MTPVTLANTVVHKLHAEPIGQDYHINVSLPAAYKPDGDPLPVVYVTDGGPLFVALHAAVPLMQMTGELPAFLLVGIDYDIPEPRHAMVLRNRDLTHCPGQLSIDNDDGELPEWYHRLPNIDPGGAGAFLDFIATDVKGLIAEHYRVSDDATYAGFSLGGLFGLFALFSRPETFTRYVIGSPSIWWADRDILKLEQAYSEAHGDLAARVFMSSGQLEEPPEGDVHGMVSNMTALAETLGSRGYQRLTLSHQVIADETHMSCGPLAMLRGLRKVHG